MLIDQKKNASALAFGDIVTHTYGSFGNFTAIVTATNVGSTMTATTPVIIVAPYRVFLPLTLKNKQPIGALDHYATVSSSVIETDRSITSVAA